MKIGGNSPAKKSAPGCDRPLKTGVTVNTLTDFSATHCCDSLTLPLSPETALRVHSVFQRACNLQTRQGALWVIQAQGMPLAPSGMIITHHDLRPLFRTGESLHRDNEGNLHTEKTRIRLDQTVACSTRLPICKDAPALAQLARQIAAFFACQPAKGIRLALMSDPALIAAHQALTEWLLSGNGDLTAILTTFIGRGEGLTPAGDDFLLGVLWVLEWSTSPDVGTLTAALPGLLARTTDISRAMLTQGCGGHYSAQLLALAQGNTRTWPAAVANVADYGHSSGHDMLAGILTAATALAERREKAPLHIGPF